MSLQLHNLLVSEDRRKIRTLYVMRVLVVSLLFCCVAVLLGVGGLVPSYLLLKDELATVTNEVDLRKKGAGGREAVEEEVVRARLVLTTLSPWTEGEHITDHLSELFQDMPEDISIIGFSYDHLTESIELAGVAATRADLVAYTSMLEAREDIGRVVLPIANLARNTKVAFSLTITFLESEDERI